MLSDLLLIEELMEGHVARLADPDYPDKAGSRRALEAPSVRDLIAAGDYEAASDMTKDVLGLEGDTRVYIVPPGATVSVDFGGAE